MSVLQMVFVLPIFGASVGLVIAGAEAVKDAVWDYRNGRCTWLSQWSTFSCRRSPQSVRGCIDWSCPAVMMPG